MIISDSLLYDLMHLVSSYEEIFLKVLIQRTKAAGLEAFGLGFTPERQGKFLSYARIITYAQITTYAQNMSRPNYYTPKLLYAQNTIRP